MQTTNLFLILMEICKPSQRRTSVNQIFQHPMQFIMKQVLQSFFLSCALIGSLNAQDITVTPNPVDAHFEGVTLVEFLDLETHVAVTNNTSDSISLKWEREVPSNCFASWQTLVCDNNQCYAPTTSTNFNPTVGINKPFILGPGETYSNFLLHVQPAFDAGCCEVKIHFSTTQNPDEILATAVYDVRVNDPNCSLSSTDELATFDKIKVFPNPTTGQFTLNDNPFVKEIAVFNLFGQKVCHYQHMNGQSHNIENAPDGLYLVQMLNEDGETLKTVRLTKQGLRP
jgi:Secretion system C-terminal sorting domain